MVSDINNIGQSTFPYPMQMLQPVSTGVGTSEPSSSFDIEDQAIISSQAKLLYELEKFNSGEGDAVDLALAGVMAKLTTSAEVNVINTKKDMMDSILKIGE